MPNRKHCFQQFPYCCVLIRYRGNLFTPPLPRNGRLFAFNYFVLQPPCHNIITIQIRLASYRSKVKRVYFAPSIVKQIGLPYQHNEVESFCHKLLGSVYLLTNVIPSENSTEGLLIYYRNCVPSSGLDF
jgi:hypothetical protein